MARSDGRSIVGKNDFAKIVITVVRNERYIHEEKMTPKRLADYLTNFLGYHVAEATAKAAAKQCMIPLAPPEKPVVMTLKMALARIEELEAQLASRLPPTDPGVLPPRPWYGDGALPGQKPRQTPIEENPPPYPGRLVESMEPNQPAITGAP